MPSSPQLQEFAGKFRALVDSGKRFLLLTHVRPDGDAYGCILALAHSLRLMGKEAVLWNEDGISDRYRFLPGSDAIQSGPLPTGPFHARIVLDNAEIRRAGVKDLSVDPSSPLVNIDHHASNVGYGDLNLVESKRGSCGEILYDLLLAAGMPVSKESATCLYVAISTDTGSFQYPATTPATLRTAAELIEKGLDVGELTQQIYESMPPRRLLLLREILPTVQFAADHQIGWIWIRGESFRSSGALPEDTEGLIDYIRALKPVKVAVLFEEIAKEGMVRMSFRSKDRRVDVNRIAQKFGGGGHAAAAGARVQGKAAEVEKQVIAALQEILKI